MKVYKLPFIENKSGFGFIALWPYLPPRFTAPKKFSELRDKIVAFKGGIGSIAIAAEFISQSYMLKQKLGKPADWTLSVIPASNQNMTETRFKTILSLLSLNLGFINGFDLIRAEGNRSASSWRSNVRSPEERAERKLQQDRDSINILQHLTFSKSIKGKKIILFDDILTTGKSFELIAFKLMELGAEDVFGLFLSKTVWPTEKSIDFEFDPNGDKPVITQRNHKLPLKNGVFSKNGIDIEWVDIPAGSFIMGCPDSEINRFKLWRYGEHEPYIEEQYLVSLSGFKMSKYAITFHQYDAFCELTGRQKPKDRRPERGSDDFYHFRRALCPVVNVDWYDAKAFADFMDCRLPTEAEWEYACRAGTNTTFNKGNYLKTTQANFFDPLNENWWEYWRFPKPVGTYPPNAWDLYEMHGNVREWCNDWRGDIGEDEDVHLTNPMGPSTGTYRVLRGGSYSKEIEHCRSASRLDYERPRFKNDDTGFRLVIS